MKPTKAPAPPTRTGREADAFLREFRFAVHGRPKDGPVTWKRDGKVYEQRVALLICEEERKRLLDKLADSV